MHPPLLNVDLIPTAPHPGAFGVTRQHHIHEGVDLYGTQGQPVCAIQQGTVVAIYQFTGEEVGSPWWNDTYAIAVADCDGVWVYGEIEPPTIAVGSTINEGQVIGHLTQVLKKDKGRPMTMLHLERWAKHSSPFTFLWPVESPKPDFLIDPTTLLQAAYGNK